MSRKLGVIIAAHEEADRIGQTIAAVHAAFPGARVIVADDASTDATAEVARSAGAEVVVAPRNIGKGGNATLGAELLLAGEPDPDELVLLCDADLGESAARLAPLIEAVERGEGDLAVAVFARRVGGGFGLALGAAGWVIRRRTGLEPAAPISGQRAMRVELLRRVLPFAPGFGMETAMTVAAHRAGFRLAELELELEHRATGRTAAGFAHRARQLRDILRVYAASR
ncbi:MAG: glycosyltransferase [Thermoleophilaceae bacterium]|nr:glycosyltransferase [Thermoleophilaceae bacterium]